MTFHFLVVLVVILLQKNSRRCRCSSRCDVTWASSSSTSTCRVVFSSSARGSASGSTARQRPTASRSVTHQRPTDHTAFGDVTTCQRPTASRSITSRHHTSTSNSIVFAIAPVSHFNASTFARIVHGNIATSDRVVHGNVATSDRIAHGNVATSECF